MARSIWLRDLIEARPSVERIDDRRRHAVLATALLAGVLLPVPFVLIHLVEGHWERLAVSGAAGVVCLCLFVVLRATGAVAPVAGAVVLFTAAVNVSMFFFPQASRHDLWWAVMTPPPCAFLFGARWGTLLAGVYVVGIGAVAAWQEALPASGVETDFASRFVGVLVVVSAVAIGFERGRARTQERLERARAVAIEARDRLEAALAHAEQLARAATAASEAKTAFLAKVSHEIRTPLNGVLGMVELLAPSELEPEQRERVETVRASGQLLLGLVEDLIDVSRVEAGKLQLVVTEVDVRAVVEVAGEIVAPAARAKGLDLEVAVSDDVPRWIRADGERLGQVIGNLLGNAVKFTPDGKVSLSLRTSAPATAWSPCASRSRIRASAWTRRCGAGSSSPSIKPATPRRDGGRAWGSASPSFVT